MKTIKTTRLLFIFCSIILSLTTISDNAKPYYCGDCMDPNGEDGDCVYNQLAQYDCVTYQVQWCQYLPYDDPYSPPACTNPAGCCTTAGNCWVNGWQRYYCGGIYNCTGNEGSPSYSSFTECMQQTTSLHIGDCYNSCPPLIYEESPSPDCSDGDDNTCKVCMGGGPPGGNPPDNGPTGGGFGGGDVNWNYNPITGGINLSISLSNLPKMSPAPSFSLYYNSLDSENYGLGAGWKHTYLTSLVIDSGTSKKITIKKPSGTSRVYVDHNDDDDYTPLNKADKTPVKFVAGVGYKAYKRDGEIWVYNTSGVLTAIEDVNGKQLSVNYATNIVSSVVDDYQRELQFTYTGSQLTAVTDPLCRAKGANYKYAFTYDGNGRLQTITYPEGRQLTLQYNASNKLTQITDNNNVVVAAFSYDDDGKCIEQNTDSNNYLRQIANTDTDNSIVDVNEDFEETSWDDLLCPSSPSPEQTCWLKSSTGSVAFVQDPSNTYNTVIELSSTTADPASLAGAFIGREKIVANFKLRFNPGDTASTIDVRMWDRYYADSISQHSAENSGIWLSFKAGGDIKVNSFSAPGELGGVSYDLSVTDDNGVAFSCTAGWHTYRIVADTKLSTMNALNNNQIFELHEYVNGVWKKCSYLLFNTICDTDGCYKPIDRISYLEFKAVQQDPASHFYLDDVSVGDANSSAKTISDSLENISFFRLDKTATGYEVKKEGCSSCGGSTKIYTFDANFNNTQIIDTNGNKTQMVYDSNSWMTSKSEAVGTSEQITTTYNGYHGRLFTPFDVKKVSVVTHVEGDKETIYDYDDDYNSTYNEQTPHPGILHQLVEKGYTRDADGTADDYTYTTKYSYNADKQLTLIEGPRTDINDNISFTYYANESGQGNNRGSLHTVTYPYGSYTYESYDPNHNVGKIIDPNGVETSYAYDSMGRVATITAGTGENPPVTQYVYT